MVSFENVEILIFCENCTIGWIIENKFVERERFQQKEKVAEPNESFAVYSSSAFIVLGDLRSVVEKYRLKEEEETDLG